MRYPFGRRAMSMTVGAMAFAAVATPAAAQSTDIHGAVTLESGSAIPKGHLEIYLEDPAVQGKARRSAQTRIKSDGGSKTIAFSLASPAGSTVSPALRIVVRLERADGWLVARGSAPLKLGSPVNVTLNTVTY
ncbi:MULTISPECIES: hypothetical protein [unclassified Rhizobium]|uniref:hypothetical protein n=1 Tax=unclassified Rhizobium TaxID=2613769 RepID=UPI0006F4E79A|nr:MULTISPECIES: hypothetical protein [unclassified Rhizobium]KQV40758.1 hypothetical protein ASC86_20945 [Rhizobium sp. Root1212]KRD36046.1 hypothetical protein ASE37_20235 [Rhizobium sp. Root268]